MDEREAAGYNPLRKPRDPRLPPEPPMRVVTKGWWVMREELVPREELERQDRLRRK